jgi:hypothetical protein
MSRGGARQRRTRWRSLASLSLGVCVSALSLAGCGGNVRPELFAETASFDVVVGKNPRLMFGVSDRSGNNLNGGTVQVRLRRVDGEWSSQVPASSIGVPGRPQPNGDSPRLTGPAEAVGVYATGEVTVPGPGVWEVEIDAGDAGTAITAFEASDAPMVLDLGAGAPSTKNPTIKTPGITAAQLNSLALDAPSVDQVPHPILHQAEIAASLTAGRPIVVIAATPAYCSSQFCGPLVDVLADLAPKYPTVDFVLLEVYPDGYEKPVSIHAAQWISEGGIPTGKGNEPWVFLVDRNGKVADRWDNVVDIEALTSQLDAFN